MAHQLDYYIDFSYIGQQPAKKYQLPHTHTHTKQVEMPTWCCSIQNSVSDCPRLIGTKVNSQSPEYRTHISHQQRCLYNSLDTRTLSIMATCKLIMN